MSRLSTCTSRALVKYYEIERGLRFLRTGTSGLSAREKVGHGLGCRRGPSLGLFTSVSFPVVSYDLDEAWLAVNLVVYQSLLMEEFMEKLLHFVVRLSLNLDPATLYGHGTFNV